MRSWISATNLFGGVMIITDDFGRSLVSPCLRRVAGCATSTGSPATLAQRANLKPTLAKWENVVARCRAISRRLMLTSCAGPIGIALSEMKIAQVMWQRDVGRIL
jgi:hypothetical protein